ncbi:MAG TPA: hypothetical protein VGF14_04340 [Alphaproteobacteria bacterium]
MSTHISTIPLSPSLSFFAPNCNDLLDKAAKQTYQWLTQPTGDDASKAIVLSSYIFHLHKGDEAAGHLQYFAGFKTAYRSAPAPTLLIRTLADEPEKIFTMAFKYGAAMADNKAYEDSPEGQAQEKSMDQKMSLMKNAVQGIIEAGGDNSHPMHGPLPPEQQRLKGRPQLLGEFRKQEAGKRLAALTLYAMEQGERFQHWSNASPV